MLDEVDKLGADFRGDPAAALLEVLDPEQNHSFSDHYLEVEFDLSRVMFITTANVVDPIPPALRDRMEMIRLPGYAEEEKLQIARKHLIPRQLDAHGLKRNQLRFPARAIRRIISEYTREAGLRNLEREIAAVCRKVAKEYAEGRRESVKITDPAHYLGPQRYFAEIAEKGGLLGVAVGVAWTPSGGDILFIEATKMKGTNGLTLTGQLGDVMKESAQTALSYLRSNARAYGIDEDVFSKYDIHIHVPAGAIPKDGPSAGIAMTVALASALSGRKVRADVAMTGEITLRGRVLPVGGIREKVLAAKRARIRKFVLPRKNGTDLEQIPEKMRKGVDFLLVETIGEALEVVFEKR
jgi:ATP-dependent Lon protease